MALTAVSANKKRKSQESRGSHWHRWLGRDLRWVLGLAVGGAAPRMFFTLMHIYDRITGYRWIYSKLVDQNKIKSYPSHTIEVDEGILHLYSDSRDSSAAIIHWSVLQSIGCMCWSSGNFPTFSFERSWLLDSILFSRNGHLWIAIWPVPTEPGEFWSIYSQL